jgi:phenylpropionate dioxygenase-like ring-hydroxylating dioxygenase large terminal subunit
MERATFERFVGELRVGRVAPTEPFTVPAARYADPAHLARELGTVFTAPRVVAASSEVGVGGCLPIDLPGASALLTRGADGVVRAFANACRHRGTRLVDAACERKALVCPYHGWTYGLDGALMHVPHEEAFVGIGKRDLAAKDVVERHGLIWLGGEGAGELDADLAALGLDRHVLYRRSRTTRRCNWKLVIEAFLDGYHLRALHRDSIYRFFLDAASYAEAVGPHIRAVTGRRALRETAEMRVAGTPSFVVFPSTVIIAHPDFTSVITVYPLAPDVTDWDHLMLVPKQRAGEVEHWAKSWQLIEETVFQREDLWVCEQIQRSIASGATEELLFGTLEEPVRWFHAALDDALR